MGRGGGCLGEGRMAGCGKVTWERLCCLVGSEWVRVAVNPRDQANNRTAHSHDTSGMISMAHSPQAGCS